MLWCIFYTHELFFSIKIKISIFGGISKFLKVIVFGQILADFDCFGAILGHNFLTVNPNIACSISLERYDPSP
jgi:hypothetical protein